MLSGEDELLAQKSSSANTFTCIQFIYKFFVTISKEDVNERFDYLYQNRSKILVAERREK